MIRPRYFLHFNPTWLALVALLALLSPEKSGAADTNNFVMDNAALRVSAMDDQYRLSVGDQLSFQIIEDEEDPKQLAVTDSGDLQAPYIGRFRAAGKTCKTLAADLKAELEKTYYYHATVIVTVDAKPRSSGKIYIVGAVHGPGSQDLGGDETLTVSRAVLRAGGFTEFADEKNVRVTRGPAAGGGDAKKVFTVNVAQVFEKGRTENDLELQPGDLIFVPERMIRF